MPWISLFPTVKTAALYLVPIKSYSKNTHGSSILKWILEFGPARKSIKFDTSVFVIQLVYFAVLVMYLSMIIVWASVFICIYLRMDV